MLIALFVVRTVNLSEITLAMDTKAIMTLTVISQVAAKYLEILGNEPRTYNNANLERVKRYMQIVSGTPAS